MIVKAIPLFFFIYIGAVFCEQQNSRLVKRSYKYQNRILQVQTQFFREKCEENGFSDAFFEVQKSIKEAHVCYRSAMYNMEESRPDNTKSRSDYAIHSTKEYCAKWPELEECYDLLAEGVRPCLTPEEKYQLDSWLDAWHQLLEYVCFEDAERPSRFIADGGMACVDTHQKELEQCTNGLESITQRWIPDIAMFGSVFEEFREGQCAKLMTLKDCVLTALGRCGRSTYTDSAGPFLDILLKGMPCEELMAPTTDMAFNWSLPDDLNE